MEKAVVTGGAGFIGSHLAEMLVNEGFRVIVIDDLSTGRLENIKHLTEGGGLQFIEGSITDLPLLQKVCAGADYIFHHAALPSVSGSIENPSLFHEVNLTGTLNVLLAARDRRVKKVIFASSAAVYGDSPLSPKHERMLPSPKSPYAAAKLAAESYCAVSSAVYDLSTVCLRYFNVYGLRQARGSQYAAVISVFMQNILHGKPPCIFGDGEQTRDFVYVKDVVRANLLAALSSVTGVFNIGTGETISINHIARTLLSLMGREDISPVYEKERPGDIRHSLADISAAAAFGYRPIYPLSRGLVELVSTFKNLELGV